MDANKKNIIRKLEKNYLRRKFIRTLKTNKNIFEHMFNIYSYGDNDKRDQSIESIYDVLIKYIQDPDRIKKIRTIFSYFNRYSGEKLYSRVLLSAYIITIVPEFVLNMRRSKIRKQKCIETEIFVLAEKVVNNIHRACCSDFVSTFDKFDKDMKIYTDFFKIFIRLDKIKKINELVNHWCDTEETVRGIRSSDKYSNEQRNDALNIVKNTHHKIEANIKMLDKNYDLSKLSLLY